MTNSNKLALVQSEETVARIAHEIGLGDVSLVQKLTGGMVNQVFRCQTHLGPVVLRLNTGCLDVFQKERWAMRKAQRVGVNVPQVNCVGESHGLSYMVMSFEEGDSLASLAVDRERALFELGRQSRLINDIAVVGYGFHLNLESASPHFTLSWQEVVEGEHDMIFRDDACVKIGALSPAESNLCKRFLEGKRFWKYPARLCHGDLNFDNVLVQRNWRLVILDWTQTKGGAAPYFDLAAHCMRDTDEFATICRGYGLSSAEMRACTTDFHRVALTDVMRAAAWAYSVNHPEIRKFTKDVQAIFSMVQFP